MSTTRCLAALAALLGLLLPALSHAQTDAAVAVAPTQVPATSRALFWDDFRRGWHFYEEPEPEVLPPAPAKPAHVAMALGRSAGGKTDVTIESPA